MVVHVTMRMRLYAIKQAIGGPKTIYLNIGYNYIKKTKGIREDRTRDS